MEEKRRCEWFAHHHIRNTTPTVAAVLLLVVGAKSSSWRAEGSLRRKRERIKGRG